MKTSVRLEYGEDRKFVRVSEVCSIHHTCLGLRASSWKRNSPAFFDIVIRDRSHSLPLNSTAIYLSEEILSSRTLNMTLILIGTNPKRRACSFETWNHLSCLQLQCRSDIMTESHGFLKRLLPVCTKWSRHQLVAAAFLPYQSLYP